MANDLEVRHLDGVRADTTGATPKLAGHAIVVNVPSEDLGGFREIIAPEAIPADLPRLVMLANHDTNRVLGTVKAKTLRVETDARGLRFEVDMPDAERGLVASVARGDITGASFSFRVLPGGDEWDVSTSPPTRTVRAMEVREISAGVIFPAYTQTHVAALRSLERAKEPVMPDPTPTPPAPVVIPDPVPPVPPVVTRTRTVDAEARVLNREQSVRSWVAKQDHYFDEGGHLSFGEMMRAMVLGPRNDIERRVLAEGADSTGGITVPDVTSADFIDKLRAMVVCIRAGARTVPLQSDVTKMARLTTDPTVAWRAENAAVAESDPAFDGVTFAPKSLDVFFKVSRELLEDSINIETMLETALLRAFAVELDRAALFGSGTSSQPLGLRNMTSVNQIVAGGGTTAAQILNFGVPIDTLATLWTANVPSASAALMAPRTLATLAKLREGATTGQQLIPPAVLTAFPWLQTTSIPITETQGGVTTCSTMFFGDFTQMMFGIRTSMAIEVARELFRGNYQYGFYGHLRADVQVQHQESFARLVGISA